LCSGEITEKYVRIINSGEFLGTVELLVVDGCWVSVLSGPELLGVFARCAVVERTVKTVSFGIGCGSEMRGLTLRASVSIANPSVHPLRLSYPLQNSLVRPSIVAEQVVAVREVRGVWR
jgi:hypothetical protein